MAEFKKDKKEWYEGYFRQQNPDRKAGEPNKAAETVAKISKYDKANINIRTTKLEKGATDAVLEALTEEVNGVKKHVKLIEAVGQEAMKQRHWQKVFDLLKEPMP
jgi:hypothetical protein